MFEGLNNKTENGGTTADGRLSAVEWNAFIEELIEILSSCVKQVMLDGVTYSPENGKVNLGSIEAAIRVAAQNALSGKQDTLVSGVNIKTVNGTSILGNGNISISGEGEGDVNVIEAIKFNGNAVPVDSNTKTAVITVAIPDAQIQSDWNQTNSARKDYIKNKPTIPAEQIQSDWNQSDSTKKDYIKNKPNIPTVPTNVSSFNNDAGYLTQHQDISGKANKSEMGVVAGTGSNADKVTITLKSGLSVTVLTSHQDISGKQDTLVSGTNVKTINGESILGSGNISVNGGSGGDVNVIETVKVNGSALTPDANKAVDITVPDISGKADKVSSPTNGNFAALDSNGNLTDSGHKHSDYLTSHQDISGKADKSEMSVVAGTGNDSDKTTITLKSGTSATVLTQHQDISGKADSSSLGTAAVLNVASNGDASSSQVVKGDDTRLTDARTPTSHSHTVSQITDFPTIPSNIVTGASQSYTIWTGTQAQYEAIGSGNYSSTTIYLITST